MQSRRAFLAAAGAGALSGLAGCLSATGGGAGGGADAPDGPTLESLDVGGSPGGPVPVLDGPTLLDFWATWCAPCKPQMAELRTIEREFPDLHMLSITNERETEPVRSFWTEYEGTWAVAQDTDLRTNERFDVSRVPTLLVFDAEGTEQWRHSGLAAADSIHEQLVEAGVTPTGE